MIARQSDRWQEARDKRRKELEAILAAHDLKKLKAHELAAAHINFHALSCDGDPAVAKMFELPFVQLHAYITKRLKRKPKPKQEN